MPRTKNQVLTLRTTSEIKALLRLAAEQERRSVASMVEVLVLNHAKQHGLDTGTPRVIRRTVHDGRGDLLKGDKHWQYGVPTVGTASFAWVQDIIHHLAPTGVAGFVLANGSMSSNQLGVFPTLRKAGRAES